MERPKVHPKVTEKKRQQSNNEADISIPQSIPGNQFSEVQSQVAVEDVALSDDTEKITADNSLDTPEINNKLSKAANYEKFLPEQYLNHSDSDIRTVVQRALNVGEVKFVETLIRELRVHSRKSSLIKDLWAMVEKNKGSFDEVKEQPGSKIVFTGSRDYTNKDYLNALSKEQLIRISQQLGLVVDPGLEIGRMASSIAEYSKISKISKQF